MYYLLIIISSLFFISCKKTETQVNLNNPADKQNYSIGQQIGKNLKSQNIDVRIESLTQGINDALNSKEQISPKEIQMALEELHQSLIRKREEGSKQNLIAGEKFLFENKKLTNLKTLSSGVQYLQEREGRGRSPKKESQVKLNYTLSLIDGSEVESTYKKNIPLVINVNQTISGWREVLPLMKEGSRYKIFVPASSGYGLNPKSNIPVGSVLIYDIELLEVK